MQENPTAQLGLDPPSSGPSSEFSLRPPLLGMGRNA